MKINKLILEAAYDSAMAAMKNKSPEWSSAIDWGKTYLKRQDRVVWYLNIIKKLIADPEDLSVLGGKNSLEAFQESLYHFIGQDIPRVQAYQFTSQNPAQVFNELAAMEAAYRKEQDLNAPVPILPGDYKLIEFADKSVWWFADRAYCEEEGRSGQHCGNVAGQEDPSQRILSYRINGRVQLTFILLEDGTLGEMKAKANQKPQAKYHPHIMALLLLPMVKGIKGAGYLPEMNFSVFDLDDGLLAELNQKKPQLISDQITATPHEFLHAPAFVRANYKFRAHAVGKMPGIAALVSEDGLATTDIKSWEQALKESPGFIIYAPSTLDNYRSRVVDALTFYPKWILQSPKSIRFDFEIISAVLEETGLALQYVLPNTPRYSEMCIAAIERNGNALQFVPENLRDRDMCRMAVNKNGSAFEFVPENLRDRDMCETAVKKSGYELTYVPDNLRDYDMCMTAVKSRGDALRLVPENLRDLALCMAAVKQAGEALRYVPKNLQDRDICLAAVDQNGSALRFVPKNLRDWGMCMTAVKQNGTALGSVPYTLRDRDMCETAVKKDGYALEHVPQDLHDRDMYLTAVTNDGLALKHIPEHLRDRELCLAAVKQIGIALPDVPRKLRDLEMCKAAVTKDNSRYTMLHVPSDIRPLLNVNESQELARLRQLISY